MAADDIRRAQARRFGQRVLHQLRRIANYGSTHRSIRVTLHAIDSGELLGHVDLDFATADVLYDIAKVQADTWDRETGVTGEVRDGEWDQDTFQRMHRELADDLDAIAMHGREVIASGEWSAAAVAQNNPDLYADVTDLFAELDLKAITKKVLNEAHTDNLTVNRALDAWFGDIPDPTLVELYGDEDGGE